MGFVRSKKVTTTATVPVLLVGLLATGIVFIEASPASAAACSTTATGYAGGAGTSGDPFQVSSAAELIRLSTTTADWSAKHFVQMADINLGDCEWTPIGTSANKFTGSYNGSGYTIQGFKLVNTSGAFNYDGFFGFTSSATIQNLVLVGQMTSASRLSVGGLIGEAENSSISKVLAQVDITHTADGYVGGLMGAFQSGTIRYSAYLGSISTNTNTESVGSFAGYTGAGNTVESYARATMSGASPRKGGMGGSNAVRVSGSYTVTPGANHGIGGRDVSPTVSNSFWDITLGPTTTMPNGNPVTGATGKTTSELNNISTFSTAGWNIVDGWEAFSTSGTPKIWGICSQENNGYPFLLWEYTSNPCTSAPGAPTISAITAGNGQLSVAFTAPGSDGGASITNYDYSIDDGANWVTPSTASTTSPLVITGLTNATAYPVKIRARNSVGGGTASSSVSGTPVAPSSSSSSYSPVVVSETQVKPRTIRQPTVRQASGDTPARLEGKSLGKDVLFVADSAKLSPVVKKTLRQAARLAIASGSKVAVTGFAALSSKGSSYEKSVAQRRALAVARYLRSQGVATDILYHGLSGRAGLAFEGQPRRVEIRTLKN
jgi:outer membrane protein OmpA-like peptidoglycan-associated protein